MDVVWMPKVHHRPFAVPGDNGMVYFEWGAVLECLGGEVTGLCALLTGSMLAQERLMPAGRHFLTGHSPLSLPPPPHWPPGLAPNWLLS